MRWIITFGLAVLVAISGCQSSSDIDDALNVKEPDVAPGEPRAPEVIGAGSTTVALVLPLSAGGSAAAAALDVRNGSALATNELGDGKLRLLVLDSGGDNARFATAVGEAAGQGAKLVIVGNGAGTLAQSVEGFEAVSLAANHVPRPKNTLAFGDDKTTSLAEGIIFSAANGARDVVVIAPDNHDRQELNWLASKLSAITRISIVTYSKNASANQAVSKNRKKLAAADAIAFAASDKSVAAISQALGNSDAKDVQLIGHTGWPASFYKIKSLNGAIVARPEANDLGQLARRYQSAYGTPISISAAYGYDLVAVAAGIVRVLGPSALNRKNLLSSSGFKGSTGVFRFLQDGSVERLYAFHAIENGGLSEIQGVAEGF